MDVHSIDPRSGEGDGGGMSESDREMLELAAKAASQPGSWIQRPEKGWGFWQHPNGGEWNPLTDDGDALRLAEECSISFGLGSDTGRMRVVWFIGMDLHALDIPEDHPMALPIGEAQWLRFAIVRAAAEIGEGLAPFPTADEIRENWT